MLVLSRTAGRDIKIGDNVLVKILSVRDGTVKIGVDAPKNVNIARTELLTHAINPPVEVFER